MQSQQALVFWKWRVSLFRAGWSHGQAVVNTCCRQEHCIQLPASWLQSTWCLLLMALGGLDGAKKHLP